MQNIHLIDPTQSNPANYDTHSYDLCLTALQELAAQHPICVRADIHTTHTPTMAPAWGMSYTRLSGRSLLH